MEKQIEFNNIARIFGTTLTIRAFQIIRNSYRGLIKHRIGFGTLKTYIDKVKKMVVVQRDLSYYSTSWKNYEKMAAIVWKIVKPFGWKKNFRDCDDRAKFVSALFSFLFDINTCGEFYVRVKSIKTGKDYLHWCNIIVTSNGDCYLFDVDNGGLTMRLSNQQASMGKWTYELKSCRF